MENQNVNKTGMQEIASEKKQEEKSVSYKVGNDEVKLSVNIVKNFLTKGNSAVSEQDIRQFIAICMYNKLNPFLGEAFLIKFANAPAQMIVSKEHFFKKAEANQKFKGIEAGIIIKHKDGKVEEVQGAFMLPEDTLLGGWAKVYRDDRQFPIVSRVTFAEYNKKQSTWNEKPATMISKVAKVQALREAFPAQLGAMYTEEEVSHIEEKGANDVVDITEKVEDKKQNLRKKIQTHKAAKTDEGGEDYPEENNEPNLL